jgi:type III pantothenate kinase
VTAQQNYPRLVIDAGNSTVKFAVVTRPGAKLQSAGTVATEKLTATWVRAICGQTRARSAAASSVVPRITTILGTSCPSVSLIQTSSVLNFRTDVDRRTVGADRLANIAEAVRQFGNNVIVADFGTAATFDVLDGRGWFIGGAIAPGLRTLANALSKRVVQLPAIDTKSPRTLIGKNTQDALRAGICGGYAGLVAHLLEQLGAERRRVVFTGGDARVVAKMIRRKVVLDPLWTLGGIAVLGALNTREPSK